MTSFGDKAAPDGAVFSQGLFTPVSMTKGLKPSLAQLNFLVSNIQKIAKTALPISIVKNPGEINGIPVNVTPGENPPGGVIGGRIYLFSDNIRTVGEAEVTLFHELFHVGIQKVIPAEQYAALMRTYASNPTVRRNMETWMATPEGQQKKGELNSARRADRRLLCQHVRKVNDQAATWQ